MTGPNAFTVRSARTVIQSNGKPRRFVLSQPPHFRTGNDVIASVDAVERDAVRAIAASQFEAREKGAALARR